MSLLTGLIPVVTSLIYIFLYTYIHVRVDEEPSSKLAQSEGGSKGKIES